MEKFRAYKPTLEDCFEKPKASGAKPNEEVRKRKPEVSMVADRIDDEGSTKIKHELEEQKQPESQSKKYRLSKKLKLSRKEPSSVKTQVSKKASKKGTKKDQPAVKPIQFNDPDSIPPITHELHHRSRLPRMVSRCQGNCGEKILTSDKIFFLLNRLGRSNSP